MTLERSIQKTILKEIGGRSDVRLFRNNVGACKAGNRYVKFGLHTGSGDLIGWKTVVITPEMVGKKVAVFLSIETKKTRGEPKTDQKVWAFNITQSGGIAGYADSLEKARGIVDG